MPAARTRDPLAPAGGVAKHAAARQLPPAAELVRAWLDSEEDPRARFAGMDAAAQVGAVANLRAAIAALRDVLTSSGADVSDDEATVANGAGGAGGATDGASAPPKLTDAELDGLVLGNVDDLDPSEWQVPTHCVPIHANVTSYNWKPLYEATQFDVIMMDPPWQLATANPTRGVALGYSQLTDRDIQALPVDKLQSQGYLFIWVINAKYKFSLDLFRNWGYDVVDEIVWVKSTVNRRLAKSHGYYLQHAKEVCLVGKKRVSGQKAAAGPSSRRVVVTTTVPLEEGDASAASGAAREVEMEAYAPAEAVPNVSCDIIFSERRGQSQKPEEIYDIVESLVPNGRYLEIFARKNNLRDFWVSVGNEVTGTGAPPEDAARIAQKQQPNGAVYGAAASRKPR